MLIFVPTNPNKIFSLFVRFLYDLGRHAIIKDGGDNE